MGSNIVEPVLSAILNEQDKTSSIKLHQDISSIIGFRDDHNIKIK